MFEILACHGTSAESRAIEFLTGPRSHIRIRATRDCYVEVGHNGKPVLIKAGECGEAWNTGVRNRTADGNPILWDTDYETGTIIEVFSLRDALTEDEFKAGESFLCRQIGKPYDWPGCERLALHPGARKTPDYGSLPYGNYDKWFCSELAAALFAVMGKPCFNGMKAYDITPQLLPESLLFSATPKTLIVGQAD